MSYIDRLRPAIYVAPDGTEQEFFVNTLKKIGGKKSSTQEIIDSNQSLSQDQGNKTYSFPISAYFPGPDYDLTVDVFLSLLEQRHSLSEPGLLVHPRYGNITVFPTEWTITEELISGTQIGRIEITFVEVFPIFFPFSEYEDLEGAYSNINDLESLSKEISENIDIDKESSKANVSDKVDTATGTISNAMKSVLSVAEDLQNTFNNVQRQINAVVDLAGNVVLIFSAVQTLLRTPGRIIDRTVSKIDTYGSMINDLSKSILGTNETSKINLRNNSILMQLITGFAVAAMAEAVTFGDYQLRSEIVSDLQKLNDAYNLYLQAFEQSRTDGKVSEEYSGDHNYFSLLLDTITRINRIIINQSFNLKAEKKYTLKINSDVITECFKNYKKIDQDTITFFQNTNKIIGNEYIELPAGREIVVYV